MSKQLSLVEAEYGQTGRLTDFTGKKVGKLTVLEFAGYDKDKYGYACWKCLCDCGREVIKKNPYLLRVLKEHSCGKCKQQAKDLTGQRFGKLVVLEKSISGNYQTTRWLCLCDCGNRVERTNNGLMGVGAQKAKNPLCCGCSKFADITGQKFGKLLALHRVENDKPGADWLFQCDCGNTVITKQAAVKRGMTKSCGCLHFSQKGLYKHKLNNNWRSMINRCHLPTSTGYPNYGARGIYVCDEWRNDFLTFFEWAMANGYEEGLHLDRQNNSGPYSPENCKYVTPLINANNTRHNKKYKVFGKTLSKAQIYRKYNTTSGKIEALLWDHTLEEALTIIMKEQEDAE